MNKLKLVPVTEKLSDSIYEMFQEIPYSEPTQDDNVANGLSRDEFRKYCVILEMASKNILLSYRVPNMTYFILFDDKTPIGWYLLKMENLPKEYLNAGHIGYSIRPSKRGMGYGTAGLRMVMDIAKKKGYRRVCVTSNY